MNMLFNIYPVRYGYRDSHKFLKPILITPCISSPSLDPFHRATCQEHSVHQALGLCTLSCRLGLTGGSHVLDRGRATGLANQEIVV